MNQTKHSCTCPIKAVTSGPRHHFFGFYDVCPWSPSGRFLLAHEVGFIDHPATSRDSAVVGVIDLDKRNQFQALGETSAWNFQQGARLQWVPGEKATLIYNVRHGTAFQSRLLDLISGVTRVLPLAVYALHPDGRSALTLNFARLQRLGGYGYAGGEDTHAGEPVPKKDGIYHLDLQSGEYRLLLSIADVAGQDVGQREDNPPHHYITHLLFNRQGTRFCFLHRFLLKDGGGHTRLMTANPDGSDLWCLAEGSLSHFDWFSEHEILIWGRHKPLLARARQRNLFSSPFMKPLLALARSFKRGIIRQRLMGDRYLVLKDRSEDVTAVGVGTLTEDGHPTRFPDSNWILTDTYADKDHFRTLILYNLATGQRLDVGRFYSLPDLGQALADDWDVSAMRSDLHPRWNRDETQICIDSVHNGTRQMYVMDVQSVTQLDV